MANPIRNFESPRLGKGLVHHVGLRVQHVLEQILQRLAKRTANPGIVQPHARM